MINDEDKKKIIYDTTSRILKLEKVALDQLLKPAKIKLIDNISTIFEEEYSKYENK